MVCYAALHQPISRYYYSSLTVHCGGGGNLSRRPTTVGLKKIFHFYRVGHSRVQSSRPLFLSIFIIQPFGQFLLCIYIPAVAHYIKISELENAELFARY